MYEYNYDDIVNSIKGIETEFPVHQLSYKNVHVWPLLKSTFNYQFYRNANEPSDSFDSLTINKTFKQKIGDIILAYKNFKESKKNYKKCDIINTKSISNKLNTNTEKGIFLTFTSFRNQKINGGYFNTQSDAFLSSIEHPENVAIIEFTLHDKNNKPHYNETINFDYLRKKAELSVYRKNLNAFIRNIFKKNIVVKTFGFEKENFENYLASSGKKVRFKFHDLVYEMNLILAMKDEFKKIYAKINPDYVACPIYCSLETYASTLAANELGIKTIEVQHGAYSHPVYEFNCEIPKKGFELVPNYFLSWDEEQNEVINNWAKNTSKHHALVFGINPIKFWKKNTDLFENEAILNLKSYLSNTHKIHILFTISDFIDEKLVQLIQQTKETTFWYVRNHPRALNTGMVNDFIKKMNELNCDNYDTINSTNAPLYTLLKSVDYHLSSISSIVTEAAQLNVPSIVISESGVQFLGRIYKNNPYINFETSLTNILSIIRNKPDKPDSLTKLSYYQPQSIISRINNSGKKSH